MPNRKSDATQGGADTPETGGNGEESRPEDVAAEQSSDAPLPPPGAELEPAAPPRAPAEPAVETVAVDESYTAPEPSATDAVAEAGDETHEEQHEEPHEEEGGSTFAARALTLLIVLIAGIALGIWGAPKLAPMLPSGLAPVAAWLTPGGKQAEADVAALSARVDEGLGGLQARIADLKPGEDINARIDAAVTASETRLSADIGALQEAVDQLDSGDTRQRLARLEATVNGQVAELATLKDQLSGSAAASGQLSEDAAKKIDVYRAELDGLRAEMGALQDKVGGLTTRIDQVAANADRKIETAQSQVSAIQSKADSALGAAEVEQDIALIRAALASGQPYKEPMARLSGRPDVTVPDGLQAAAASGVSTLAMLRDSFPDAAHAAIRASIMASAGDGMLARSRAYLEAQMASRSLTPQPGNGPDAVLSRMEDRLQHDDLAGALHESEALPSEAAAAMSDWLDAARLRAGAVDGLAKLAAAAPAAPASN